jgi:hypothetical protein
MHEEVTKKVDTLYAAYGSDSGVLFGIPPQYRGGVEMVAMHMMNDVDQDVEDLLAARQTTFVRCPACQRYREKGYPCQFCGDQHET